MELSKRLQAVADLVTPGLPVADVGTDHGYIPIYLKEQKIAERVIALDVNRGPLERARIHIERAGLADQIETRLSDGLRRIIPGEVDTIIAAGMGGGLIRKILEEGKAAVDAASFCILQPQSEIARVRRYLAERDMKIVEEDMVFEEGKYYTVMKAAHGPDAPYEKWEYLYGRCLLRERHEVLKEYLSREIQIRGKILGQLKRSSSRKSKERIREVEREIMYAQRAYDYVR